MTGVATEQATAAASMNRPSGCRVPRGAMSFSIRLPLSYFPRFRVFSRVARHSQTTRHFNPAVPTRHSNRYHIRYSSSPRRPPSNNQPEIHCEAARKPVNCCETQQKNEILVAVCAHSAERTKWGSRRVALFNHSLSFSSFHK